MRTSLFVLFVTFFTALVFGQKQESPLQGFASLSASQLTPQEPFTLSLNLSLASGYRAYKDKFSLTVLEPEGFSHGSLTIQPLENFYDGNTQKKQTGIINSAVVTLPMEAPAGLLSGNYKLKVALSYQACTKKYCLFPQNLYLEAPFSFKEHATSPPTPSSASLKTIFSDHFGNFLEEGQGNLFFSFLFIFLAGFLTSLTPCVFPVIPITIAVLGRHAHLRSRKKHFTLSLLYVLGIAITYALMGVLAAGTGALFGSFMNHPVVLSLFCLVFFTMSLSMFGLFDIQPPEIIRRRLSGDFHLHGYHSTFIYGIIAGIVVGPCVGPVLVGILTFVAKTQNLWFGFWLLLTFALGMGVLFLAIGFSSQMTKLLPKSGPWMEAVKNFFGLLMLATCFYYLNLLVSQRWWDGLLGGVLLIGGGVHSLTRQTSTVGKLRKVLDQTAVVIGTILIIIGIFNLRPFISDNLSQKTLMQNMEENAWITYSEEALDKARQMKRPVLIDFRADWCEACKELEEKTFTQEIFTTATKKFLLMKFDATNDTKELQKLKDKYNIVGLPTLILYDSQGVQRKDLTITEFLEASELIKKLQLL